MNENESKKFDINWEVAKIKYRAKQRIKNGTDWVVANKDLVMFMAPIIISGTATLIKVIGRNVNLHKEQNLKELYCYDRSAGHYWELRRKLTRSEWVEIDRRRMNGERYADILSDMKVLK